jgi:hypothetical protein
MNTDDPFKPTGRDTEMGFYFDSVRKCLVWEETLTRDDSDPWNIAMEKRIKSDDRAFVKACGIAE